VDLEGRIAALEEELDELRGGSEARPEGRPGAGGLPDGCPGPPHDHVPDLEERRRP